MKFPILSIISVFAVPLVSANSFLTIPNASFEEGGEAEYIVPTSWVEDQPRGEDGFSTSGRVAASDGLAAIHGNLMARVTMTGDSDSSTSFSGTISTTLSETFAPDTTYELQFYVARNSYITSGQWYALGGLRANGVDVASVDVDIRNVGSGEEDVFYPVSLTFSTADNPIYAGDTISVYLGMRHEGDYLKALFFDDVTLTATAIPEPSTYAILVGLVALIGVALRRRRHR